METKYIILIITLILVLSIIIYLISKNKKDKLVGDNSKPLYLTGNEEIIKFKYQYNGTAIGDIYTYEIYKEDNQVKLKIEYMNINEDNPDIIDIKDDTLTKLMDLIKEHKANEWHGYKKTDSNTLDGNSFYVSIKLTDNKEIEFSGTNCAPDGYYDFQKDFLSLIEKETKTIKDKYNL